MDWTWLDQSCYELTARIGNGAFSSVYRAKLKPKEGAYVAIKVMDLEHISSSFEDILQEVQTMKMCDDPNILRCFCSFVNADQLWLVTELMDKGSCLRVMNVSKNLGMGDGMSEEWLAYILREALQGLHYLHANGQIHRDIKSGNVLLDGQGSVRLADFGVSGWTVNSGQRQKTVKTFVGTPVYMAPEVMEQAGGYDFRADIWSLGITALELAKGVAPYAQYSAMKVLVLTIEEEPPSLRTYPTGDRQRTGLPFSKTFEDFVTKCLQKNPRHRPGTEELLKHKFFKNRSCYALVDQLLNFVPSVGGRAVNMTTVGSGVSAVGGSGAGGGGGSEMTEEIARVRLPGESPIAIEVEMEVAAINDAAELRQQQQQQGLGQEQSHLSLPLPISSNNAQSLPQPHDSNPPAVPSRQYVAGTTWVFDDDSSSVGGGSSSSGGGSFSNSRGSGARLRVSAVLSGRRSGGGLSVSGGGESHLLSSPSNQQGDGGEQSRGWDNDGSHRDRHHRDDAHDRDRHDKDIDSFLNDFEENAASMTLHPIPHNNNTTTTNTSTNANANVKTSTIPNPTTTASASAVASSVSSGINVIHATTNATANANVIDTSSVGGNVNDVGGRVIPATVCISSVDDEDGTDAFMDELEDIIK